MHETRQPLLICSGPDEASIVANYYPLVQNYLRQQQHERVKQDELQPQEQHELATPLQAILMCQQEAL